MPTLPLVAIAFDSALRPSEGQLIVVGVTTWKVRKLHWEPDHVLREVVRTFIHLPLVACGLLRRVKKTT